MFSSSLRIRLPGTSQLGPVDRGAMGGLNSKVSLYAIHKAAPDGDAWGMMLWSYSAHPFNICFIIIQCNVPASGRLLYCCIYIYLSFCSTVVITIMLTFVIFRQKCFFFLWGGGGGINTKEWDAMCDFTLIYVGFFLTWILYLLVYYQGFFCGCILDALSHWYGLKLMHKYFIDSGSLVLRTQGLL